MENSYKDVIEKAYSAFNERNIDKALATMQNNVQWSKAWEGGYISGHIEIKEYWKRQWSEINPIVHPVSFIERKNGTLEVQVHQNVKDLKGNLLFDGIVKHIYTFQDGLIKTMNIEPLNPIQNTTETTTEIIPIKLYSKGAIRGFSIFFSSVFGGVLLMQNLKDLGKRKEANIVLWSSIALTVFTIIIIENLGTTGSATILCNIVGGAIISDYFYSTYIPDAVNYGRKKIWKALLISVLITIPFFLALIYCE